MLRQGRWRETPDGAGLSQPAAFGAVSSTASRVGSLLSSLRRSWWGFWPAAWAISSTKHSRKKPFCEWLTERQKRHMRRAHHVFDMVIRHFISHLVGETVRRCLINTIDEPLWQQRGKDRWVGDPHPPGNRHPRCDIAQFVEPAKG